jgi:hypothetical protein
MQKNNNEGTHVHIFNPALALVSALALGFMGAAAS